MSRSPEKSSGAKSFLSLAAGAFSPTHACVNLFLRADKHPPALLDGRSKIEELAGCLGDCVDCSLIPESGIVAKLSEV